jgi:hypothetical protein
VDSEALVFCPANDADGQNESNDRGCYAAENVPQSMIREAPREEAAQVVRQRVGCHHADDDQDYSGCQEKHAEYPCCAHLVSLLKMSDLTRSSHMVPMKNEIIKPTARTPRIKSTIMVAPFPINDQ